MLHVVAPLALGLSLLTAGPQLTRPDFSGKWTQVPTAKGEPAETLIISQTTDTLTIESPSPSGMLRWVFKLDGSESKNITVQGNPPREIVDVSTTKWDGNSLVSSTPGRSNRDGPYVIRSVMSLDGNVLVTRMTQTSQTTGVVQRDVTTRFSK